MSKKIRLSKEEKKAKKSEKKANKVPMDEALKSAIASCISIFAGTCIICATVSGCVTKCTQAKLEIAKNATASNNNTDVASVSDTGGFDTPSGEPVIIAGPSDTAADDNTDVISDGTDTASEQNTSAPGQNIKDVKKTAGDMSKAEITALYTNAANSAKSNAKSITQNVCDIKQTTGIELDNKFLAKLADSLIAANVGEDEKKRGAVYTGQDVIDNFPVSGQKWASKLTEQDIKTAEISEKGDVYYLTLRLIDDTQDNLKAGEGHAGKAISLITKEQIVEGAGSAGMAVIAEDSIKVRHSNCIIKAQIDKKTGNLIFADYYREWRLSLTALGIDVALTFGIKETYTINWK